MDLAPAIIQFLFFNDKTRMSVIAHPRFMWKIKSLVLGLSLISVTKRRYSASLLT